MIVPPAATGSGASVADIVRTGVEFTVVVSSTPLTAAVWALATLKNDRDEIVVDGSLEGRDATVRYLAGGRLLALASLFRDRESLEAELAMENEARSA